MKIISILILTCISAYSQELSRKDLFITIYNQNLALVRDIRNAKIEKGINSLNFTDIASGIISQSVKLKALKNPLSILEQNFEYDLINSDKMLNKFIDNQIKIITKDNNLYSGNLLSFDQNFILIKTDDGKVNMLSRENIKDIEFSKIPQNFRSKPTLEWLVSAKSNFDDNLELSYLTNGISWQADYVAVISNDDRAIDLNSWVTINNNSGANYEDANVKLMAGDINLIKDEEPAPIMTMRGLNKAIGTSEEQFSEKSFFEYHIYDLNRKTTIKNNQIKQISLFNSNNIKTEKSYIYDGAISKWYFYDNWRNQNYNKKVDVTIKFKNSKDNNLGLPMPKGKIRIYKKDNDSLEFIGEDNIDHTPKDEEIELKLGQAFDVTGERKVINHQMIATNIYKDTYQIKIKNHKDSDIKVIVKERLYGDWKITENSHDYVKKDKNNIEFSVNVEKGKEAIVKYSSESKF
jgi:hypothetical protein